MDIKYFIEPVFKIEFFKIECIDFNNKKKKIEKVLDRYPEMPQLNFSSNRDKCNINSEFQNIFKDEFNLIRAKYNSVVSLQKVWSVSYNKGDYHVPHNHSSIGYCGILYLDMKSDSPKTTYIQPWNNERDRSVLYSPEIKQGDIMIIPQHLWHYTSPNLIKFKKRIISFDFVLKDVLF
jgi:hypothetical protein|tara:strand:- start:606 stop:1139 length:534 start_codon:yes stop_codon:yes gene_type:complete